MKTIVNTIRDRTMHRFEIRQILPYTDLKIRKHIILNIEEPIWNRLQRTIKDDLELQIYENIYEDVEK